MVRLLPAFCLCLCVPILAAAEPLAQFLNTQPLTWDDDLADRMMDGLHRFVERKIEHAVANRQQLWKRDTSSPEAYEKSIAPNRERLKKLIGLVDQRVPSRMEFVAEDDCPEVFAKSPDGRAMRVRWEVLDGVTGEGVKVAPWDDPVAHVILLPDASHARPRRPHRHRILRRPPRDQRQRHVRVPAQAPEVAEAINSVTTFNFVGMSQHFSEFFGIDFDVSQDFSHQSRPDVFSLVDRNCRSAAVGMFELPMTSLGLPQKLEAQFFQGADEFARFDVRQIGVAHTVTST